MNTYNQNNGQVIYKIKEVVGNIEVCMFITDLASMPFHAVPMRTKKVDNQGNLWFLSSMAHEIIRNLQINQHVELVYSKPRDMDFMTVFGTARIVVDRGIIKDLYEESDDELYDTHDDPNIKAIVVNPLEARHWDKKSNNWETLLAMHPAL